MKENKEHYYPGRVIKFLQGNEVYDPPVERAARKKRLKSEVSYDPIVCEYRWTDCLAEAETPTWFRFYRDGRVSYWFMDGFFHGFTIPQNDVNKIISCIDKYCIYALPEKINSTRLLDGIYQILSFFDSEGHEIVKISGNNPWSVYKEINVFTNLLEGIIEPYIARLPRQKPRYDMFNADRHNEALKEAQKDVEDILLNAINKSDDSRS